MNELRKALRNHGGHGCLHFELSQQQFEFFGTLAFILCTAHHILSISIDIKQISNQITSVHGRSGTSSGAACVIIPYAPRLSFSPYVPKVKFNPQQVATARPLRRSPIKVAN